jgi:hypothetical protein
MEFAWVIELHDGLFSNWSERGSRSSFASFGFELGSAGLQPGVNVTFSLRL